MLKKTWPFIVLAFICFAFFYKTFLFGRIPFPADLLLAEYTPWRQTSYFGYAPGAIPIKGQYFDVLRELYPWKHLVVSELKNGNMPLWNPYNFSGTPLLANYQSAVFYPLSIVYFILPFLAAWALLVVLQPLLGSFFLFLFATEIGISTWGAILAAVAFNFSYFANVWVEFNTVWHTILWLPFLLWLIERILTRKNASFVYSFFFVLAQVCAITAGHPQDFINMFLFTLIYLVSRLITIKTNRFAKFRIGAHLALLTILSFGITAVQWLPTVELFKSSARVPHDYRFIIEKVLIQPAQLIMLLSQDFFGNPAARSYFLNDTYVDKTISVGLTALILAILGLSLVKKNWHVRFFATVAIVITLITVHTPISELMYRFPLPILSTGSPTRLLFLFALALSLLAGFGFDAWDGSRVMTKRVIIGALTVLVLLWLTVFVAPHVPSLHITLANQRTMFRSLIFTSGIFTGVCTAIFLTIKKRTFAILLVALVFAELWYGFQKFNPFVPTKFVYPKNNMLTYLQDHTEINRFYGYGTGRIEANIATQFHLFSADGTDPLNLKHYNQFLQSSQDGAIAKIFTRQTRSDASIAPGYGEIDLPTNKARLRILDMLGVKYVLDRAENPKDDTTFSPDRFTPVWNENDWTIFINTKAAPRFFLTDSIKYYASTEEFEKIFFDDAFRPNIDVLLPVENRSAIQMVKAAQAAKVELKKYSPSRVEWQTTTDQPQLLFLSDTYDPGWMAYVDGNNVPIYKANFSFRAVVVPTGTHTVTFAYSPSSFRTGVKLSILTIATVVLLTLVSTIRHVQKQTKPKGTAQL